MSTDFTQIIKGIQDDQCRSCKFGKVLMALLEFVTDEPAAPPVPDPAVTPVAPVAPAASSRTPKRYDKRGQKGQVATHISPMQMRRGVSVGIKEIAASGMKVCKKCQEAKLLSEFQLNKGCKDGHEGACRACKREYDRKYFATNFRKKAAVGGNATLEPVAPLVAPPAAAPAAPAASLKCKLCGSPCSTREKYEKHMFIVHSITVKDE